MIWSVAGCPVVDEALEATLTGAAEVPGPGDPNGTGDATLRLNPRMERICYTLNVRRIQPATMAHIHEAPAGVKGPIVKALRPPSDGSSEGCVRLDRAKILEIKNNPSGFYVNVHNTPYPDGAVRGQLRPASP